MQVALAGLADNGANLRRSSLSAVHYESYTDARARTAIVDVERLRHHLSLVCPSKAEVAADAGGWSVFISGLPVAAGGSSFDEAIGEMVDALREYADDWQDRLRIAPNHQDNWGLVQLIVLSDDQELTDWLVGASRQADRSRIGSPS